MFPYVIEFCTGSVCLCHTGCCVHFPGKVTISSLHSFHLGLCVLIVILFPVQFHGLRKLPHLLRNISSYSFGYSFGFISSFF